MYITSILILVRKIGINQLNSFAIVSGPRMYYFLGMTRIYLDKKQALFVQDSYIYRYILRILFPKLSCRISPLQSCYRNEIVMKSCKYSRDSSRIRRIFLTVSFLCHYMHQSFVSPAPLEPGNSGVFNFSNFKGLVKAPPCDEKCLVKSLLKAPVPRGQMTYIGNDKFHCVRNNQPSPAYQSLYLSIFFLCD